MLKKEYNYQNLVTHYPGKAIFSHSRGFKIKIFPWCVVPNHDGASYVTNISALFRFSPQMGSLSDRKYSQWDNRGPLITEVCLKPIRKSTIERFCQNNERLKAVNNFRKKLHRRCSTGFKIRLCISSLLKHIECQQNDLQSLFPVKLSDK